MTRRSGDFLRVCDRSDSDLGRILSDAARFKALFDNHQVSDELMNQRVAFIWDGEGFRNRVAFELGVSALGGDGTKVPERLGQREPIEDLGPYLDNWFDLIVIRTPSFERLSSFAEVTDAPVINARTAHNHPCEILGDLAFAQHAGKDVASLNVVFIGEATNLLHSWCEAAAVLPIHVTQVCAPGYEVERSWLRELVPEFRGTVATSRDLQCVANADIIYTDCWPRGSNPEEENRVREAFGPLQVDADVLDASPPDTLFLPCPPVSRGQEVSAQAMLSSKCRVIEAKAWLLAAQNSLLARTTGGRP